jgi:membrane-bound serine protease (ClpP class)
MDYLTIALILFALGVIMLVAEVLLPTGGILVVASLLFFALGVGIILAQGNTTEAVVAVAALAVGLPAIGYVAVAAYRRMSIGSELDESTAAGPLPISGQAELEALKNRTGKTVSTMRPAGTVEFDGKRIDAMTEGVMLEAGAWVRCVAVKGNVVIVRQIDPPADVTDISPDAKKPADVPNIHLDVSPPPPPAPPASPPPPAPGKPLDDLDDLDLDLGR